MKKLLYTLTAVLLFVSCRTIEKMVEKGQYDEAIIYATEKLAGKKKKKTKHVKALEEAFAKITKKDMDYINYLDGTNKPENWDRIYDVASKIESRQNRIDPFLPLISTEGYEAQFRFVKTYEIKTKALNAAAEHHYSKGQTLLETAIASNDKKMARAAYGKFHEADNRKPNYKDVFEKKRTAHELGLVNIKVGVENNSFAVVPENFERIIKGINVSELNSHWRKYHLTDHSLIDFDYTATIEITGIDVSPERETIKHHEDSKEIKDGWEYVKDRKGKFVVDTSGNKIKVDKFKHVHAYVTEIFREKAAMVNGQLIYKDQRTGNIISSKPVNVEAVFSDYASSFRGHRKALCKHDVSRLKKFPLPFPNDFDMILDASNNLKGILKSELRRLAI